MRLATRLTLLLSVLFVAVLSMYSVWSLRESDRRVAERHVAELNARAGLLSRVIAAELRAEGEDAARALVAGASQTLVGRTIVWLPWEAESPRGFDGSRAEWLALGRGQQPSVRVIAGRRAVVSVPVRVEHQTRAVMQLYEPFDSLESSLTRSLIEHLGVALVLSLLSGLVVWWLTRSLITRPLSAMAAVAQRHGRGELGLRVAVPRGREMASFARTLNTMAEDLATEQELARSERDLRVVAVDQLRHAERLRLVGELAAALIHELGTPLNVISARAKMIASGRATGDKVEGAARIIDEQAGRVIERMRSVLDFARRRSTPDALVDLALVSHEAVELLRPLRLSRDVEVTVDAEPGVMVRGDHGQLEQVVVNLVTNAFQATRGGGGQVRIEVRRDSAQAARALLTVSDNGHGIPQDKLEWIFEPFHTTKPPGEGSGLGLSVVRGIVETYHGTLTVESTPGEGARFVVVLPVAEG